MRCSSTLLAPVVSDRLRRGGGLGSSRGTAGAGGRGVSGFGDVGSCKSQLKGLGKVQGCLGCGLRVGFGLRDDLNWVYGCLGLAPTRPPPLVSPTFRLSQEGAGGFGKAGLNPTEMG